jgi:hypothetical protein
MQGGRNNYLQLFVPVTTVIYTRTDLEFSNIHSKFAVA